MAEYDYDAYGVPVTTGREGTIENPYRYAGYRLDGDIGLYYLNARYYSPTLGRFIIRDTFHGFEDDPASLHLYAYGHGNPAEMVARKDVAVIGNLTNGSTLTNPANDKDDLTEISIRYMLDSEGFGTPADLEKRYQIEDLLDEHLRNAGLGKCGGTEIGEGFMFVYCYVTDPDKAMVIIKRELEKHGFLEGAVITRSNV